MGRRYQKKPKYTSPVVQRRCLKCLNEFESHGDRICPSCNAQNLYAAKRTGRGGVHHNGQILKK